MKNNKKYLQELKEIQEMAKKFKAINESVMFEDDFPVGQDEEEPVQPQEQTQEIPQQVEEPMSAEDKGMMELDQMGELDKIRAITLDGMRKLASQPESPQFQALNKIFQLCNKSVDKEEDNKEVK